MKIQNFAGLLQKVCEATAIRYFCSVKRNNKMRITEILFRALVARNFYGITSVKRG
jgi:hypothetical protein